ncbi:MAG: hypothetical protein AAF384_12000 [Pseudomonadota bacterium]
MQTSSLTATEHTRAENPAKLVALVSTLAWSPLTAAFCCGGETCLMN